MGEVGFTSCYLKHNIFFFGLRQLSIPGKVGVSFWWWDVLPHQPVGIWE